MRGRRADSPGERSEYFERCVETANASAAWTQEGLARTQYRLSMLYEEAKKAPELAAEYRKRSTDVLEQYRVYSTPWVLGVGDKLNEFDDLQPTDEGRFIGRSLLQELWRRREFEEGGHH